MKTNITLTLIILSGILIVGCNQNQQDQKYTDKGIDIINDEFPVAQAEIKATVDSIFKSIQNKDAESLKSFHLY